MKLMNTNKYLHMFLIKIKKPGDTFKIVGSYRRGALSSGDIDIIVSGPTDSKVVFNAFLDALIKQKILIEILSRGATKSLTIGQLPGKPPRRLDFLYSTPSEYPFAVLYFTGSKTFNTVMRQRALNLGYTMNEHGLYTMIGKKKGDKIKHKFSTERDIFKFLELQYKTPKERIDGRAIVVLSKEAMP